MTGLAGYRKSTKKLFCHFYLLCFLYLAYISNAFFYPNTGILIPNMLHIVIVVGIAVVLLLPIIFLSVRLFKWLIHNKNQRLTKSVGIFTGLSLLFLVLYSMGLSRWNQPAPHMQPNIIIIGIDSLVPTLTSINQKHNKGSSITPNLDSFLKDATVFENAWTPFARTYPAWISLLTGTYPIKNGARYNLIDPELLNSNNLYLADFLKQQGYQTIFGSDEKRFSNIDRYYGFDTLIGPKMGAADFLMAPIMNTPLTNLLINTRLGKFLFPFNHSNRAIHATYRPETFISNVKQVVGKLTDKPVFLSLHLCLPHWPYTWADKTNPDDKDAYLESVIRADTQFGSLVSTLESSLLENALVFVISDHGESKGPSDDGHSIFASETGNKPLNTKMSGHGTYVIDKTQFKIVLGVRGFGNVRNIARVTAQPASLIDIFPTIMEITDTHIPPTQFDGISLAPWITQQTSPPITDRYLFVESGYNPGDLMGVKNISSKNGNLGEIIATGIDSYRIKRNGRIVLKEELLEKMYATKQYAGFYRDRAVAIMPDKNGIRTLGINYEKKTWTQLTPQNSGTGIYKILLTKLQENYLRE